MSHYFFAWCYWFLGYHVFKSCDEQLHIGKPQNTWNSKMWKKYVFMSCDVDCACQDVSHSDCSVPIYNRKYKYGTPVWKPQLVLNSSWKRFQKTSTWSLDSINSVSKYTYKCKQESTVTVEWRSCYCKYKFAADTREMKPLQ